jgi:hypothetical protein
MRTAFERHSPLIRSPLRRAHKHSLLARPQPHPSTAGQVQCRQRRQSVGVSVVEGGSEMPNGAGRIATPPLKGKTCCPSPRTQAAARRRRLPRRLRAPPRRCADLTIWWAELGGSGGWRACSRRALGGAVQSAGPTHGNNAIGDHGAISLASALTSDTASALRRLVLNNNALGDAGATAIANALGGGHMLRIEAVDLGHNHIGGGASDLPSDLPSASLAGPDLMFVVVAMWQWGLRR